MREPQRLLARLMPVTVDWKNSVATTGEVLTGYDVAAALAGLSRGPYLLLLYLWAGDTSVMVELYDLLLKEVKTIANKENWKCKDDNVRLLALIKMALYEMDKRHLCKPCGGTGTKFNQLCDVCFGVGHKRRKYAEYAKYCGVKPSNWRKCWDEKYHQVQMVVQEWQDKGSDFFLSRL